MNNLVKKLGKLSAYQAAYLLISKGASIQLAEKLAEKYSTFRDM